MACRGRVYDRLLRPLLLAALNTEPEPAWADFAGAILKETLLKGGEACRPLSVAARGLSAAFVDPALAWLQARGVVLRFGHRLRRIVLAEGRASALDFGEEAVGVAHRRWGDPGLARR